MRSRTPSSRSRLALLLTWGWLLAVVGAVATALFVVYTVLVARVLRTGDSVECHCFGSLGGDRVTSATLARNLVLVALAATHDGASAPAARAWSRRWVTSRVPSGGGRS